MTYDLTTNFIGNNYWDHFDSYQYNDYSSDFQNIDFFNFGGNCWDSFNNFSLWNFDRELNDTKTVTKIPDIPPSSTSAIRAKNAPYTGYDRSPHCAVNSKVYQYTKYNNSSHIQQLEPGFQLQVMKMIDYAKQNGYEVKITSSFRTRQKQDALRKKYEHQPGRAATRSPHMFGKAIDIQVLKNGKKCTAGYTLLGRYAESLGVRWGGRFRTCREIWHFDYNWA